MHGKPVRLGDSRSAPHVNIVRGKSIEALIALLAKDLRHGSFRAYSRGSRDQLRSSGPVA
jgi:hypothetical protein